MQPVRNVRKTASITPLQAQTVHRYNIRRRKIRKGMRIFSEQRALSGAYVVTRGEVMILRAGRIIDIVEAGELLDASIWRGATAVAYTDCTLAPQSLAA